MLGFSSSPPPPKKKPNCRMIAAIEAKKLAMVMISTSRCFTCASSWAITPSSSLGESMLMMPVVAHTVALFWERPIAKAFGTWVSATAMRGFGRSAWMQSRSIIACRPGASSGETSLAPIADSASLSEKNSWAKRQRAHDHDHQHEAGAGREQRRRSAPRRAARAGTA